MRGCLHFTTETGTQRPKCEVVVDGEVVCELPATHIGFSQDANGIPHITITVIAGAADIHSFMPKPNTGGTKHDG